MFPLIILGLLATPVQRPTDVVRWTAVPATTAVVPGGNVRIELKAIVQPGWKLYAIEQPTSGPQPLAFEIGKDTPYQLNTKKIVAPKAKLWKDENFDAQTRYYENEASFTIPVSVGAEAPQGIQQIPLEVTFQACGQNICLRPYTQKLAVAVEVKR